MAHIPPPPPGMFYPTGKSDGLGSSDVSFSRKPQAKKQRRPAQDERPAQDYRDWITFHLNDDHQLEIRTSQSLVQIAPTLHGVIERVLQAHFCQRRHSDSSADALHKRSKQHSSELKASTSRDLTVQTSKSCQDEGSITYPLQVNSKRRRVDSRSSPEGQLKMNSPNNSSRCPATQEQTPPQDPKNNTGLVRSPPVREILISDHQKWVEWFSNAFKAIQQQGCRFIAKEWIKLIHPKKQSTHPYNGKHPRDQEACPERTRPPYWPRGVQHKEPDHIDKEARVALLVHLLMDTPQQEITPANTEGRPGGREIRAQDFIDILNKKKDEFGDKWDIVQNVIEVRTQLEKYQDNEFDDETVLCVPEFCESSRSSMVKKSRLRPKADIREELRTSPDGEAEGCLLAATVPASPADSSVSSSLRDTGNSAAALNMSFGSTSTKTSSQSTPPVLRPKEPSNNQFQTNTAIPGPNQMLLDSSASHNMGYNHHHHHHNHISAPQRPPLMQDPSWSVATTTDGGLNNHFGTPMILTHPSMSTMNPPGFPHDVYVTSDPDAMNLGPQMLPYDDSQQFAFYGQDLGRDPTFRAMNDVGQDMGPAPGYPLNEHFLFAVAHQTPQQ